jgi:hypothetical protein
MRAGAAPPRCAPVGAPKASHNTPSADRVFYCFAGAM